ncbi:hypothetical protein L7F22_017085 [Adiantum nelumboides]|nr:hypothetical protein [Adiantum nelumboides]
MWSIKDTAAIFGTQEDRLRTLAQEMVSGICRGFSIPWARKNIREVHFLPFNPLIKRTAITYVDEDGHWFRASKGAPEQILALCSNQDEIRHRFHSVIQSYADRGFRSLAVAWQEIPEKTLDGDGGAWQLCGILPLFDPPRHDSADTIRRALGLGITVKMLTGDQLAIAKETGRMLGMGMNMYPSSLLTKNNVDGLPLDDLIENADGFAGVFPGCHWDASS